VDVEPAARAREVHAAAREALVGDEARDAGELLELAEERRRGDRGVELLNRPGELRAVGDLDLALLVDEVEDEPSLLEGLIEGRIGTGDRVRRGRLEEVVDDHVWIRLGAHPLLLQGLEVQGVDHRHGLFASSLVTSLLVTSLVTVERPAKIIAQNGRWKPCGAH
jgi:hypothetical protein